MADEKSPEEMEKEEPRVVKIFIARLEDGTATLQVDKDEAYIHELRPPRTIYWELDASSPLLPDERLEIAGKADAERAKDPPGPAQHKEHLPGLKPDDPYEIAYPDDTSVTARSPGLGNKPDGDYFWQYNITLYHEGREIGYLDPWTVVQKP